jgi:dienelactone hydrolase
MFLLPKYAYRYGFQNRLFAICNKLSHDLQCYVVAMDNFRGETRDDHLDDFFEWTGRHPFDGTKDEEKKIHPAKNDIDACFAYLNELGVPKQNVSAIGFCWGVWPITRQCTTDSPFNCIVGFHPSLAFENRQQTRNAPTPGTPPNILQTLNNQCERDAVSLVNKAMKNTPILYCVAGNDADYLKPGGGVEKILPSSKFSGGGVSINSRCEQFPEMLHGWVSRGDTSLEKVKDGAEKALRFASEFLKHWM